MKKRKERSETDMAGLLEQPDGEMRICRKCESYATRSVLWLDNHVQKCDGTVTMLIFHMPEGELPKRTGIFTVSTAE